MSHKERIKLNKMKKADEEIEMKKEYAKKEFEQNK